MEEFKTLLEEYLNDSLYQMVISGPCAREGKKETKGHSLHQPAQKRKVRPLLQKNELLFQVSSYGKSQVFHENLTKEEAIEALAEDTLRPDPGTSLGAVYRRAAGEKKKRSEILSDSLHARITLQRLLEKDRG